ncbi:fructose PTS transporter subunit IIB, partial [uncultured Bartonella sp.]|uniref:fructose PTS transporter subunit IIB n=1 Tax=uncultured Bartonella sp. TaxID=104108 RepID=UPI0026362589
MTLVALIDGEAGEVHTLLAREVLQKAAQERGVTLSLEIVEPGAKPRIAREGEGEVLLLISNRDDWQKDHVGVHQKNVKTITFNALFKNPEQVFAEIDKTGRQALSSPAQNLPKSDGKVCIVAITSCPTGIAHTFMAAEGLMAAAKALGYDMRVETQGSVGAGTPLTAKEIADADLVIIAADREVDRSRFAGKRVYACGTKLAISDGETLIKTALNSAEVQKQKAADNGGEEAAETAGGVYKHLMTGVSFMLPFVVAGG